MPCVLVVEDDADVREMLRTILETEGYDTLVAANGAEALEAMQQRRPCVVLLDLMMPVMDGWTFRERQLGMPAFAEVPVICLTAVYDPQAASQALHAPCLHKPVEMDALLDRVEQACWNNAPRT
jgi:CheY-like chemotaxis protein